MLIAQRPTLTEESVSEFRSRFIIEPLEPGFGYTLGNSLRRTLLSSIPGAAVTSIRIDGVLHEIPAPPAAMSAQIVARVKILSRLDIAEKRVPQDGRMKLRLSKTSEIDFRISTIPALFGEKAVIRILDTGGIALDLAAVVAGEVQPLFRRLPAVRLFGVERGNPAPGLADIAAPGMAVDVEIEGLFCTQRADRRPETFFFGLAAQRFGVDGGLRWPDIAFGEAHGIAEKSACREL